MARGPAFDTDAYMQEVQREPESRDPRRSERRRLQRELSTHPDTPQWHDKRQKIVMAQGDCVFDKSFNRVFDSMTVALATLECKVWNMERESGYIAASAPSLPPQHLGRLRAESVRDYASAKGCSPRLLEKPPRTGTSGRTARDEDDEVRDGLREPFAGVTLSLVRQGATQTQVYACPSRRDAEVFALGGAQKRLIGLARGAR